MTDKKIIDPKDLFQETLALIESDLKEFVKEAKKGKLSTDSAYILVKYANVLDDVIKQKNTEAEKQKTAVAKMTTEELFERYKKIKELDKGNERENLPSTKT